MTREEWSLIVQTIRNTYPPHLMKGMFETEQSIRLWYEMLKDLDYKDLAVALQKHITTNKFPPTIADLREACQTVKNGDIPLWSDGWEEVIRGIRQYGYMRESEALSNMSELTRETVKRLGWQNLCISEAPGVDRGNFRMIYGELSERYRKREQLPPRVRELIANTTKMIEGK